MSQDIKRVTPIEKVVDVPMVIVEAISKSEPTGLRVESPIQSTTEETDKNDMQVTHLSTYYHTIKLFL